MSCSVPGQQWTCSGRYSAKKLPRSKQEQGEMDTYRCSGCYQLSSTWLLEGISRCILCTLWHLPCTVCIYLTCVDNKFKFIPKLWAFVMSKMNLHYILRWLNTLCVNKLLFKGSIFHYPWSICLIQLIRWIHLISKPKSKKRDCLTSLCIGSSVGIFL